MGTVVVKNVVKRKHGYLYYVDGKGNVCEAKMSRGGRKKKRRQLRFLFLVVFYLINFLFFWKILVECGQGVLFNGSGSWHLDEIIHKDAALF